MSDLTKLTILPVNKTVVFYSPIEGKDVLVRTGSIGDGSCFFHSLLHAYSRDYVSMNVHDRRRFVHKLRASIARKVDVKRWEGLSNGLIARIPFQENVNTNFIELYRYISEGGEVRTNSARKIIRNTIGDDPEKKEIYGVIFSMVTLTDFERNILPKSYDKTSGGSLKECKDEVIKETTKFYKNEFSKLEGKVSPERVKYYIDKLESIVRVILDESEDFAYKEYIRSLQNTAMEIDTYTIGLISEKFNRDIYFLDARTRMPYRDASVDNLKKRKSIIVMWTGGCHYEVVGKLLAGNRIQREFNYDDPLIRCIHTYLCNPEKVPDRYPNLVSYLPKEIRKKIGVELSDSEEDRRSFRSSHEEEEGREVSNSEEDFLL